MKALAHLVFFFIDTQGNFSYTWPVKKQVLIKYQTNIKKWILLQSAPPKISIGYDRVSGNVKINENTGVASTLLTLPAEEQCKDN